MVDGCGALGKMDEELCGRWMQVAAFMPMTRVHHNATYVDGAEVKNTDPFNWWNFQNYDATVMVTSAIGNRLKFMRHIYSNLFIRVGEKINWPIIMPLFYDQPSYPPAYSDIEHSYYLGKGIKVSPVFQQGVKDGDTFQSFFPQGLWYDLNNLANFINVTEPKGKMVDLKADSTFTNLHLREGAVIAYQFNPNGYKTTTDFLMKQRTSLIVGTPRADWTAEFYSLMAFDDGLQVIDPTKKTDNYYLKVIKIEEPNKINMYDKEGNPSLKLDSSYQYQYLD